MKKKQFYRTTRKLISLILTVILVCLTPLSDLQMDVAFAASPSDEEIAAENAAWEPDSGEIPYSPLVGELNEERQQNSKTFLREDGAREMVVYSYAVHYDDDGEWKDIDNSLYAVTMEDGSTAWTNVANDYQVWFSEGTDGDYLVKIEKDGYSISWAISGMNAEAMAELASDRISSADMSDMTDDERDDALRFLSTYLSEITYENAVNGLDVRYVVRPQMVEEFFEASTAAMAASLGEVEIIISCDGVAAAQSADGSVLFVNEEGEQVFSLGQPYMMDASGEVSADIGVSLTMVEDITAYMEESKEAAAGTILESESAAEQESESAAVTESESVGETESKAESETGTEDEPETETAAEQETEGSPESGDDTETESESETADTGETESESEQETEPGTEAESQGESEGELEREPEQETEPTEESSSGEQEETEGTMEEVTEEATVQYIYRLTPSEEWLEAEDRTYPVSVDPNVITSIECEDISDVYIHQGTPDYPHGCAPAGLKLGSTHTDGFFRTYLKFTSLPELGTDDVIIDANLYLKRYWNADKCDWDDHGSVFEVYQVLGSWDETTITWNNRAAVGDTVEAIDIGQAYWNEGIRKYNSFNLTNLVKKWYSGTANFGVMIRSADEDTGTLRYYEYVSSEVDYAPTEHPYLSIVYVNSSGLESMWSYHSQSAGRAGSTYVNDYTGALTIVHDSVSVDGGALPISISHVYNSNDRSTDVGFGKGWRLSIMEEVSAVTLNSTTWYCYLDGDGTKHYYYPSGTSGEYLDEMNSKNKLTVGSGSYTLVNSSFITRTFDSNGRLISISDPNGNTQTITYDGSRPVYVTDSAGRTATLYYGSSRLATIQYPDGSQATCYYTDDGQLSQIRDADGNFGYYAYFTDSMVLVDPQGYQLWFYFDTSTWRVKSIESITQGTNIEGPSLSIEYGWNVTSYTDNQGRTELVRFNNQGEPVSVQDVSGNAAYGSYSGDEGMKSKLTSLSETQKTSVNLLLNGNIYGTVYWTFFQSGITGSIAKGRSTTEGFMGNDSLYLTKENEDGRIYYAQSVSVTAGKTYTFSAYLKGTEGAYLAIRTTGVTRWVDAVTQQALMSTDEWNRTSVSYTVPETGVEYLELAVVLPEGTSGTIYIDCLQMEEGELSRYNLLTNSDFTFGANGWTPTNTESGDGVGTIPSGGTHPDSLNTVGYYLAGNSSVDKYVSQTVSVSGNKGDSYVFGGWLKAASVPTVEDEVYGNHGLRQLKVIFMNGSTQVGEEITADFSADTTDWQYLCSSATAEGDYTDIIFRFSYTRNCNTAWFDGLQLYKEGFGERYIYENGNLTQVKDKEDKETNYEYNENNDLVSATDKYGDTVTYTYDGKHNMLTAAALGITTEYEYDSKGNVTSTKVYGTGSDSVYVESGATYSTNGAFLTSLTDALGNTASYGYVTAQGTPEVTIDPLGNKTSYTYDSIHRLSSVTAKDSSGTSVATVSYTYSGDYLSAITRNGMSYSLTTDTFGNTTSISAAGNTLVTNEYDYLHALLTKTTYGNGYTLNYEYDEYDRLETVKEGTTALYTAAYDGDGRLYRSTDGKTGITTQYDYDLSGKLVRATNSDGTSYQYIYDEKDNLSGIKQTAGGRSWTVEYGYDGQYRPETTEIGNSSGGTAATITNTYDTLSRLTRQNYALSSSYAVTLSYNTGANGSQSTQLKSYQNGSESAYQYEYDDNGNIVKITYDGKQVEYEYDALQQLTREDNQFLNKSITYTYDEGGNLTSKKEYAYTTGTLGTVTATYSYSYGNTWKDQLTAYNGQSISYDTIGNPTTYRDWTFGWSGRNLTSISKSGTTRTYTYNNDGLRTTKTVDGTTTSYAYQGSLLMAQQSTGKSLYFSYDTTGKAVSVNYNGTEYYYLRNGQGDIVGLLDQSGTKVVSYTYDSWGKLISTEGTVASTLGVDNPLRYRGYYYDVESGFYYVSSRYYDPEVGRWINADDVSYLGADGSPLSYNLYAYCLNNPVNMIDSSGEFGLAIGLFIGASALIGGLVGALTAASTGGNVLEGALEGAATGGIAAAAVVFVPQLIAPLLPAALSTAATVAINTAVTAAAATAGGMLIDVATQGITHSLEKSDEEFTVDSKRMIKTGLMTGLSSLVPTIVDPTKSLTNAFGAAVVGWNATIFNGAIDIIVTNIFK